MKDSNSELNTNQVETDASTTNENDKNDEQETISSQKLRFEEALHQQNNIFLEGLKLTEAAIQKIYDLKKKPNSVIKNRVTRYKKLKDRFK